MTDKTIVQMLTEGATSFSYTKTDGSTRKATGTLNPDLIPENKRAGSTQPADATTVAYYDLDANDWRSFRKDSLVAGSATSA